MGDLGSIQWMTIRAICDLASRRQWVCWKYQERGRKKTKVPYQPNGKPASTTAPHTWSEMPTCFTEVVGGHFDGLGYVLSRDDGRACVDLDHCFEADKVTLKPWAAKIVQDLDSYTERSPGGDGLHIWCIAHVSFEGRRHEGVEIYASGRYLTVTGEHFEGTPETLRDCTAELEKIVADFPGATTISDEEIHFTIDPDAIIDGEKHGVLLVNNKHYRASWDHTRRDLADQSMSSYDMSLATIAAYAGWTDQEIVNLLIAHRRKYGNPEKALRADYLQRTLRRARQATEVRLKDYEAAEVHRVGEGREVAVDEGLAELSTLLALDVTRVIQRGRDPASYSIETREHGELFIGGADLLLSVEKARARLIASSRIYLPPMKKRDWERIVQLIVQVHEYEELAEGQRDQEVDTWLASYLHLRPCSEPESMEQLARAIETEDFPIQWEGEIYLRTVDLKTHIFSAMGEKVTIPSICTRLREAGCIDHKLQVRVGEKNYQARTWKIR